MRSWWIPIFLNRLIQGYSRLRQVPEVSVVIPVFNKALYLSACLDSVRQQTLQAIEIICIDDCSTDSSAAIAAEHASADERVIVHAAQSNIGPGPARNLGLARARGKFVFFLDADDVLPANSLEILYTLAVSSGADLAKGTLANFLTGHGEIWVSDNTNTDNRQSFRLNDEPRIWVPYFFPSYLYRRDFLVMNRIAFPALRAGEDPVFLAQCLVRAKIISSTSAVTYIYRRDGSAGQRRITPRHLSDFVAHVEMVKRIYIEAGHEQCWQEGCVDFYLDDVRLLAKQVNVSDDERAMLCQALTRIWPTLGPIAFI